jgi:DNA mismatch repair protein MLH1
MLFIEHVVFPAFKRFLLPPKSSLVDKSLLQIANLPDLYKVFERC